MGGDENPFYLPEDTNGDMIRATISDAFVEGIHQCILWHRSMGGGTPPQITHGAPPGDPPGNQSAGGPQGFFFFFLLVNRLWRKFLNWSRGLGMLIFMVFGPFLVFMGGGTPHEMLIFLWKTFIFGPSQFFPGGGEVWGHGEISWGVPAHDKTT